MTGQDRWLLMLLGRGPARAAVADIPGVNAFALVTNGPEFVPSAQSEALVDAQKQKLVDTYGAKGRQILQDLEDYAAGVTQGVPESMRPWTVNDAIAVNAFIGSIFGNGGGDEVRNSDFLAKLRTALGSKRAAGAFEDLMEADDGDAPDHDGAQASATARRAATPRPARRSWTRAPPRRSRTRPGSSRRTS